MPRPVPTPARTLGASERVRSQWPMIAPAIGHTMSPKGGHARPTTTPMIAPTMALRPPPNLRAPSAPARCSSTEATRASSARMASRHTPSVWKSVAKACTSAPAKMSGVPGSTGTTAPTSPASISNATITSTSVMSVALHERAGPRQRDGHGHADDREDEPRRRVGAGGFEHEAEDGRSHEHAAPREGDGHAREQAGVARATDLGHEREVQADPSERARSCHDGERDG